MFRSLDSLTCVGGGPRSAGDDRNRKAEKATDAHPPEETTDLLQGPRAERRVRLALENLEARELLAASVTANLLSDGTLRIEGTEQADKIHILQDDATKTVKVGSSAGGTPYGQFSSSAVKRIEVFGLGGDDLIDLQGTSSVNHVRIDSIIDAGAGKDTVVGSDAADRIFGGAGLDTLFGKAGNDFLFAEADGGSLDGGAGTDINDSQSIRPSAGGKTFYVGTDSHLYSLSPATGAVAFSKRAVQGFAVSGDFVYMLDSDGSLTRKKADGTGATNLDSQLADGKAFFLDSDGFLHRVDPTTHSVEKFKGTKVKSFDVTSDGNVFVLETDGDLYKRGANGGSWERFNSSKVDSFSIRADVVYTLESDTGHLVQRGSNDAASESIRLKYQESNGHLFFVKNNDGTYLFNFNRATGYLGLVNKVTESFTVSGDYLINLQRGGTLVVTNAATGKQTISENEVKSYVVADDRVIWLGEDGYLRQRDLGWSKVSFADDENGSAKGGYEANVVEYGVTDGYLHLRTVEGVVKVIPVGGKHTIYRGTDLKMGAVTGYAVADGKVFMYFEDGFLREQNLDGTGWLYAAVAGEDQHRVKVRFFDVIGDRVYAQFADGYLRDRQASGGNWYLTVLEKVRVVGTRDQGLDILTAEPSGSKLYRLELGPWGYAFPTRVAGAMLVDDVLVVAGTEYADDLRIEQHKGKISVAGMDVLASGQFLSAVPKERIGSIEVAAWSGDDVIAIDQAVTTPATIRGGSGKDIIQGGSGDDVIYGEQGDDVIAGGGGADDIHGGSGANQIRVGHLDTIFIQKSNSQEEAVAGRDLLNALPPQDDYGLSLTAGRQVPTDYDGGPVIKSPAESEAPEQAPEPVAPEDDDKADPPRPPQGGGNGFVGYQSEIFNLLDDGSETNTTQVAGAFLISDFNPLAVALRGEGDSEAMSYNDVVQQGTPTCAFAAALSAVAQTDYDLAGGIRYVGVDENGRYVYDVRLHVPVGEKFEARWVRVAYDGNARFDRDLGTSDLNGSNRTVETGEFWTVLYQKAYLTLMKVTLTTDSKGRVTADCTATDKEAWKRSWQSGKVAMQVLTGRKAYYSDLDTSIRRKGDTAVIAGIQDDLNAGRPVTAGTIDAPDGSSKKRIADTKTGLVHDHAYTVVGIQIPSAGDDEKAYVILRNPWGQDTDYDFNGDGKKDSYNDGWHEGDRFDGRSVDKDRYDGLIRVSWSTFKKYFESLSVGQV